jgi:hypothetical protein
LTRTMNVAHAVEPSDLDDSAAALRNMLSNRTGARAAGYDAGRFVDNLGYVPEQVGEVALSIKAVSTHFARLGSRWLGPVAPDPLVNARDKLVAWMSDPANQSQMDKFKTVQEKIEWYNNFMIMAGYPIACAGWTVSDAAGHQYSEFKWPFSGLVTLECIPELLHSLPKADPDPDATWNHPVWKWQEKPGFRWTQKDLTQVTVFGKKPLGWVPLELIAAGGITASGAFKPAVRQVWETAWKLLK